jgi:hypothetical protein
VFYISVSDALLLFAYSKYTCTYFYFYISDSLTASTLVHIFTFTFWTSPAVHLHLQMQTPPNKGRDIMPDILINFNKALWHQNI